MAKQYTLSRSYTITEEMVVEAEDYPHAMCICKKDKSWDSVEKQINAGNYEHHKIIGVK